MFAPQMAGNTRIHSWALVGLTLVFSIHTALAKETGSATVAVVKKEDGQPLPDAIVKVIPLDSVNMNLKDHIGFTDASGKYNFAFNKPVVIQISHLGFTTLTDTIYASEQKTYSIGYTSKEVKDVVITGQYAPNSIQNSVYEVKVLNAETLKAKGANNLREALQNELHIDMGQDQVFGSNVSINGISGEGVKIMVDGVPIVGRLDGKLDLSQINLNNIDRIEIVEGPLSVIYGTDAMGGVINIITKTFQEQKINLNLKAYYETVGQYNIELNTGFAFKKNQIYLSGGRNFFDGYTTLDSVPRYQEWKPKEQYFADAKYIYGGNRFRITTSASFFRELMLNRSAPRQTPYYGNTDTTWTYVGDDIKYLTYRPRADISLMYRFKENYQLDVLAAYSGFFRFTNKYYKDLVMGEEHLVNDPDVQDTARYHEVVVRATYSMPAWKNRINFQFGIETNQEFTKQSHIKGGEQKEADYAAFGSVRLSLVKGLDIQPAIRVVYNTRYRVPLIPSLNVKYGYKDFFVIRASYGRGYRAPSLKELYMVFFDSNHAIKGNDQLVPENAHTGNLSVNGYINKGKHKVHLTASAFYNNINDKIDFAIFSAPFPPDTYQYFNLKKYITYGGNVGVGYTWNRLSFNTSVLLTKYELRNSESGSDKVKTFSPDFIASASYLIPKAEIGINVSYKYDGQKPLYSVSNSIQAGSRGAYHMLDLSLSRNFWKNRIQVVVGGKNLIGVKDVATTGVEAVGHNFDPNLANVGWGRTFFTTLILHFSK